MTAYYKVLGADQGSHHGGSGRWVKNRWRTVDGELVPCRNGIHFCRREQLIRWLGPQIWVFEDGSPEETLDSDTKMVTRRGRVVERFDAWNDVTARLFAADCAESVLCLIPEGGRGPFAAAVAAARGFARGKIDQGQLVTAKVAAWNALNAAEAAAWAATWAATKDEVWAAAKDAAEAAAEAATRDASDATAKIASWDVQTELFFDYLEGRRT